MVARGGNDNVWQHLAALVAAKLLPKNVNESAVLVQLVEGIWDANYDLGNDGEELTPRYVFEQTVRMKWERLDAFPFDGTSPFPANRQGFLGLRVALRLLLQTCRLRGAQRTRR